MNRSNVIRCLILSASSGAMIVSILLAPAAAADPVPPGPSIPAISARCGQPDYRRAHSETCRTQMGGRGGGGAGGGLLGGLLGGLGL